MDRITVELPSGAHVRVPSAPQDGPTDVGFSDVLNFDAILTSLREFASLTLAAVQSASPDEVEIEFSVGVDASTGQLLAFICSASTEAILKFRLLWTNDDSDVGE